jgi:hypothetical protein
LLLVTAWVVVCTQQNHMSVNPASRYATMESLVERGTWSIDESSLRTVDKVQVDGRMYSSKPPLMVALMTPAYVVVRAVQGFGFSENAYQTVRAMRLFVAVGPWLIAMFLWLGLVRRLSDDPLIQLWASTAMIAGGLSTAYASHLDNHSVAMAALLAGAALLAPLLRGQIAATRALAGGLAWGFATTCDLGAIPAVGLVGSVGLWLVRADRRAALALLIGLLAAPIAQTILLLMMTGDPRPFYLRDGLYNYAGSYWRNPIEFDALDEPWPLYAFHSLIGHHGLFSATPWLLLAIPWFLRREDTDAAELVRKATIGATLFVVAYYTLRTSNYGGRCVGMRWYMVLHPILAVASVRTVVRRNLVQRRPLLLGALTGWSTMNALLGAINPWEEGLVYATFRALGMGSVPG